MDRKVAQTAAFIELVIQQGYVESMFRVHESFISVLSLPRSEMTKLTVWKRPETKFVLRGKNAMIDYYGCC